MKNCHIILIFAQDEKGVIERIAMSFRRKMYNISQISTSDTEKEGIKKITVELDNLEDDKISKILKQINKIIEVIDVVHITYDKAIVIKVALVKIKNNDDYTLNKLQKMQEIEVLNVSRNNIIFRVIQNPEELKKILEKISKNFIINEITTSGAVVMEK